MTPDRQELEWALRGDVVAVTLLDDLNAVLHLWDDLIDRDRRPGADEINDRMYRALVTIPRNPFYRQHFATLSPLLEQAIFSWLTANAIERDLLAGTGSQELAPIAFVLRSDYANVLIMAARIIGGPGWAVEVAQRIRRRWHGETLEGYRTALMEQHRKAKEPHDEL